MTKRTFKAKGNYATNQLGLVHADVCGPVSVQARGGYEYFTTFTYDYSSLKLLKCSENIRLRQKNN